MSTNTTPGISLRRLHDKECANFAIGSAALGQDLVGLVDEAAGLYLYLAQIEAGSSLAERDAIAVTHFLPSCVKDLGGARDRAGAHERLSGVYAPGS